MPKFAYVATAPDGQRASGAPAGAPAADAAELALLRARAARHPGEPRRRASCSRRSPRRGSSARRSCTSPASSARSSGPGCRSSTRCTRSARRPTTRRRGAMLDDIEDGLRRGEQFSDCLDRHPRIFPTFYRGILRSAELTGQLDTVLDQLADYLERDLEARRKIKSALIYPADRGDVASSPWSCWPASCCRSSRRSSRASTPSCRCRPGCCWRHRLPHDVVVGDRWPASPCSSLIVVARAAHRARAATRATGCCCRSRCIGDDHPVRAGRAVLPDPRPRWSAPACPCPRRCGVATESLRNRVFIRGAGRRAARRCCEGEGLAGPLAATELFPGTAAQMIRVGEDTGTLDDQLEVTAALLRGRARLQDQEAHRALRAGRHHRDGR